MSGWDFDEVGKFGSKQSAEDFAKRNNVDPRDIRTRDKGDGVELEIRRSSLGDRELKDSGEGRRDGWS
ncbi:hypothetical protein [Sphingomonas sp. TDK1]|uniref:hypothetical protein n=1 Tax=Sphingomonas sp. TDK1 TaxID=453247 RepID=UPI0007DA046C|nr:hypothetical protein [Sphingomonas sp. TDK1]OAN65070.1 hypothetical protein A7X12_16225 [Sphingomonas sp. TDK1]